ncbi:IclR family transcriptional regulator (plasmid) [Diaphorobacter sp. HDW4B]|uniref:IclR family transcriptional regulator n=1 Tax=Diaphorobacter sp. HDW4B TaxID=2714925 RepID=UPI0014099DE8|nr:IclR family transcriptional regulator [Diaphorobacter sp. HDW4B]QIL74262.1 IclR family transcriptional regulator [Diaphorobacter sp. HDW4B]
MSNVLERTLGIFELLARHGEGLELANIADTLHIPRSAAHRLLGELARYGYVRQPRELGAYMLTTKLTSLGLSFLSHSGITDFSQPLLDRLAASSGELVRLSVVDGARLTWVARAQGARQGLRYDPDMGSDARLSCSSSGIAWMSALTDDEAIALASGQGMGQRADYGPNAPKNLKEMMKYVKEARTRGFSITIDTYTSGLSAMAAVVQPIGGAPIGAISIAGPTVRFTEQRMQALGAELIEVAAQMAAASGTSPFFQKSTHGGPPSRLPIYAA